MQVLQSQGTVELSWALQSALAAGIAVACGGVAVIFRRPAMRALAVAFLLLTLASLVIWAALTATAYGLSTFTSTVLLSLATPLTPVLAFLVYRQIILLVAGRTTQAFPPIRLLVAAAVAAFLLTLAIALATVQAGPVVVAVFATAATVAASAWLAVMAGRARRAGGHGRWALRMLQWSFIAFAGRSSVNVIVAAIAFATGGRPQFSLAITLTQAFLLVVGAALQLVAVLDEERVHSLAQAEQLRNAEKSVAASQRLEALGRMASAVAHDFNNVLTAIVTGAQLARESVARDHDEDLREIESSAKRGQGLTRQLLAYARQAPQRVERFDAGMQLDQMRGLLQRVVGSHATLSLLPGAPPLFVNMDSSQFDQLVMNLVTNARDATPAGGTIIVQVGATGAESGDFVHLTVTDSGSGIPDEVFPHIFEPFFTTKPAGEGSGLGLATCERIVRRLGGRIDVRSELGKGTQFDVLIPRAAAD